MPQLENQRHERVAMIVAKGATWTSAVEQVGYSDSSRNMLNTKACQLKKRTEIVARVAEIQSEMALAIQDDAVASASLLDIEAAKLYERFTQASRVKGPYDSKTKIVCKCGEKHEQNIWRFDGKNALAALDLRAKLAGLYVKNINVRHGKLNEIEGTLDQIWERIANMAEPLGREFKEWLIARWGYEVVPSNLRVIEGTATDASEASEAAS